MNVVLWFVAAAGVLWILAYFRATGATWTVGIAAYLGALTLWSGAGVVTGGIVTGGIVTGGIVTGGGVVAGGVVPPTPLAPSVRT